MVEKKYAANALWVIVEKVLRLVFTLIFLALIARKIGPSDFGIISLGLSIVVLAWSVCGLGLDNLLYKELGDVSLDKRVVLSSALVLRFTASGVATIAAVAFLLASGNALFSDSTRWMYALIFLSLPFYNVATFVAYCQVESSSKLVTRASVYSMIASGLIKVALLATTDYAPWYAVSMALDIVFNYLFVSFVLKKQGLSWSYRAFDGAYAKAILKQAFPLLVSNVVVVAYTRLDQFMIGAMLNTHDLGLYSVAVRISDMYMVIPALILSSFFPVMSKDFNDASTRKYFDIVVFLTFIPAIVMIFALPIVIPVLFGAQYQQSVHVSQLTLLASLFATVGALSTNYFLMKSMSYLRLYRTCLGLLVNAGLNLVWIPAYGIIGAAFATLVTQVIASWLANALSKTTRSCFLMQTRSVCSLGMKGGLSLIKSFLVKPLRAG